MVRFGIISTAKIARKYWTTILAAGHTVTMVGSRELARAQEFIEDMQKLSPFSTKPKAVGSYDEVLNAEEVDVVYIPLPTALRAELVLQAAKKKKHVLCEKPCAVSMEELKKMTTACEENGVQFMDGVMLSHGQRFRAIQDSIYKKNEIGQVHRIHSNFCFLGDDSFLKGNIRVSPQLEPFGALGDIGWYSIRYSIHMMGNVPPSRAAGRVYRSSGDIGVPLEFSGEMFWDKEDVSASFFCSFLISWTNDFTVVGSHGSIAVKDFTIPFEGKELYYTVLKNTAAAQPNGILVTKCGEQVMTVPESSTFQEKQMIQDMADIVTSGKLDSHWPTLSLYTQAAMEAAMFSAISKGGEPVPVAL